MRSRAITVESELRGVPGYGTGIWGVARSDDAELLWVRGRRRSRVFDARCRTSGSIKPVYSCQLGNRDWSPKKSWTLTTLRANEVLPCLKPCCPI